MERSAKILVVLLGGVLAVAGCGGGPTQPGSWERR